MIVRYDMVVDFARPSKSNTVVIAENDANTRLLHFVLLSDKKPFDMTNVTNAMLKGITSSGSSILDGEVTILEDEEGNMINEVEYLIPVAISENAGTLTITITLYGENGERITSFEMYVKTRNALYNEDDQATEEDIVGFRDLLERTQKALAKLETMVAKEALPNPEPLVVDLDGGTITYYGEDLQYLPLGHVARIGKDMGEIEETIDDSAAAQAIAAAKRAEKAADSAEASAVLVGEAGIEGKLVEAKTYADAAAKSSNDAKYYYDRINAVVPTVSVNRDEVAKETHIDITDASGSHPATIYDGKDGKDGVDGVDGFSVEASVTKPAGSDTAIVSITDKNGTTTVLLKDGVNGNKWYRGDAVSAATVGTPIAIDANTGDNYINVTEGAVYHCTLGGNPSEWAYDFTLTGGGSGGASAWEDLMHKPFDKLGKGLETETVTEAGQTIVKANVKVDGTSIKINEQNELESAGVSNWDSLEDKPFETLGSDFEVKTVGEGDEEREELQLSTNVTDKLNGYSNENLLDNPWFTVNQRGFTSGSAIGYTVDRWKNNQGYHNTKVNTDGSITLTKDNSSTSSDFIQYFEPSRVANLIGKPLTVSLLLSDGTLYSGTKIVPTLSTANSWLVIPIESYGSLLLNLRSTTCFVSVQGQKENTSITIRAVKLELGSVSTLANDVAPDYDIELLKCKTSKVDSADTYANQNVMYDEIERFTYTFASGLSHQAGMTCRKSGKTIIVNECVKITSNIAAKSNLMILDSKYNYLYAYGIIVQNGKVTSTCILQNGVILNEYPILSSNGNYPIIILTTFIS